MLSFQDLLDFCQAEAIASRIRPGNDAVWRNLCRTYSKRFYTPLHEVFELNPEHVALSVYEDNLENADLEDYQKLEALMEILRGIEDPNYERTKAKELAEIDRQAEIEEEERLKAGKAVHPQLQKDMAVSAKSKVKVPEGDDKPKGGMINLDYLSKQDSEG